ncbi:hypothetical protein [Candidatus Oleimmundimicrobium sp.]|uniref:hypothetical protein n=1 Tax=Candidatus Oleimmundimicrobium sp. TaxID=3060597 RepID=UPI0027227728|nr:hypothetical protein [Candidatus Oleimmundimicrobium sp.]MDO8886620.1 hypothetical protein [Candidatus Oleimmundimicrobium sp.]
MKDDELFKDESVSGKKSAKKKTKSTSSKQQKPSQEFDIMSQNIGLVWAVALVVVAFIVGFFVRGLFLPTQTADEPSMQAPALTEEQIQSGEMPAGHPQVGAEMPIEAPLTTGTTPTSMVEVEVGAETTATP